MLQTILRWIFFITFTLTIARTYWPRVFFENMELVQQNLSMLFHVDESSTGSCQDFTNCTPAVWTCSGQKIVLPIRYWDNLPASLVPLPQLSSSTGALTQPIPINLVLSPAVNAGPFCTLRNQFGLIGQYDVKPDTLHLPNEEVTEDDLSDINVQLTPQVTPFSSQPTSHSDYWPYPNESAFLLGEWFWTNGQQKSKTEFTQLIDILTNPHFSLNEIRDTPWDHLDNTLGQSSENG